MLEIIPAIDLIDGKCVRLAEGDFSRKTEYSDDPVEVAKSFVDCGLRRLHVVDLDGARSGKITNLEVLERLSGSTDLAIDFSGGIKTRQDIESVFEAGAAFVGIGSIAVSNSELFFDWIEEFGAHRILLGADVRGDRVAINGWQSETRTGVFDLLKSFSQQGGRQTHVTDIGRDGLLKGPSTDLYRQLIESFPDLQIIASGGVSSASDLARLEAVGCSGAIVGKAIYENRISLEEISEFIKRQGGKSDAG